MIGDYRLQQGKAADSALSCLGVCAWMFGNRVDLITLKAMFPVVRGSSPSQLMQMATSLKLLARPLQCEAEDLRDVQLPAVLQWGEWFVVLGELKPNGSARIFHPATGWSWVNPDRVRQKFDRIAIEISPAANFERRTERPNISVFSLLSWTPQIRRTLLRVLALSILAQVYVILGPLYGRIVIDDVVPKNDFDLLTALAIGFSFLALFNAGVSLVRELTLQQLGSLMEWEMTRRLFRHMIRLPLPWFQSRSTADILQKFASLEAVKQLFVSSFTSILVDGMMTIASFTMLLIFSPIIAFVSVGIVLCLVVIRLIAVPINKRLQALSIDGAIGDRGNRMDTIRAIQTIKAMSNESAREANWTSKFANNIQTTLNSSASRAVFSNLQSTVVALATVFVYYVAARLVIEGSLTIGLMTATLAYQTQFSGRVGALFEQYIAWRMLDVHLSRVVDIALTEMEPGLDKPVGDLSAIQGDLEVENLSFRYSPSDPLILDGVNLKIAAGEHVALTGRSGIGKTTLAKMLCGLYAPTSGVVKLDGKPLSSWGPRTVRSAIGTVLQNDELLSGTVAENVSFFDPDIDLERVWSCLEAVAIKGEIERMPLREQTFVGDMGIALSGGQRQRLFLARALYKEPRLLILDEATSHLDITRESLVLKTLQRMKITIILIAHRPETIAAAQRVINLTEQGVVT